MIANGDARIVFIGFPSAGKSTFLAALWHVVETGDVPGSLKLESIQGDNEYIAMLRSKWLACEPIERTKSGATHIVNMVLSSEGSSERANLVFPDLAGEIFDDQWRERLWSQAYLQTVGKPNGIVLFINADHHQSPLMIADHQAFLNEVVAGADEQDSEPLPQYSPDAACLQAKIVDVLQQHITYFQESAPISIAVVISAWDVVKGTDGAEISLNPEAFLKSHAPLVWQFLRANTDGVRYSIFGVSALGGSLDSDSGRLLAEVKPSNRIKVVANGVITNDISKPIRWIME